MADETFEIGFEVTGEGDAQKAFSDLAVNEAEAAEEAERLSAELKELAKSGKATAQEIDNTAHALVRARQRAAAYGAQARQMQAGLAANTRGLTGFTKGLSQATGAVNTLGNVVGTFNPQLDRMGSVVGSAGTAIRSVTGAMGPWGMAIAGVTTAIGIASTAYQLFAKDADDLAAAQKRATDRTISLIDALRRQREVTAIEEGTASPEEIGEAVRHAYELREAMQEQLAQARASLRALQEEQRRTAGASSKVQARVGRAVQAQREQIENLVEGLRSATRAYEELVDTQAKAMEREMALASVDARARDQEEVEDQAAAKRAERLAKEQRTREEAARQWLAVARNASAEEIQIFRESREQMRQIGLSYQRSEVEDLRAFLDQRRRMESAETAWYRQELQERAEERRRIDRELAEEMAQESTREGIRGMGTDMGADLATFRGMVEASGGLEGPNAERWKSALKQREDDYRAHQLALADMEAMGTDWTAEQYQRRVELHRAMLAQQQADQEAQAERLKELGRITDDAWSEIGGSVTDAAGQMFRFVIEGAEGGSDAFLAMLQSFLQATSVQYTIKALAEAAEAVAAAARYDAAAAAQHGIAAGMAAAVAAATGLGSAAISIPSTSAGAGPVPAGQGMGGGSGPTNITVQLYSPNAVLTEAERGEMVARSLREAERMRPGSAMI